MDRDLYRRRSLLLEKIIRTLFYTAMTSLILLILYAMYHTGKIRKQCEEAGGIYSSHDNLCFKKEFVLPLRRE